MGFSGSDVVLIVSFGHFRSLSDVITFFSQFQFSLFSSADFRGKEGGTYHPSFSTGTSLCLRPFVDRHIGFNGGTTTSGSYFCINNCFPLALRIFRIQNLLEEGVRLGMFHLDPRCAFRPFHICSCWYMRWLVLPSSYDHLQIAVINTWFHFRLLNDGMKTTKSALGK